MTYPAHDRTRFYKYVSPSTAIKILESGKVRYSSPKQFNDPFDVQSGLHFDFDLDSLPRRILERIGSLAGSDVMPAVDPEDGFGQAVLLLWKNRDRGFPVELQDLLRPTLRELCESLRTFQREYQQVWWEDFLPRLRVFCVAEEKDNLLMWSHYAKDHTGVVLEFAVLPDEDNALCVADYIRYRRSPIPLFTLDQWLDDMSGVKRINPNELYMQYAYVKSDVWAYEKEWRVWVPVEAKAGELHNDYALRSNELKGVYLGCNMSSSDREIITTRARASFPNAMLYSARKASDTFSLIFDPV